MSSDRILLDVETQRDFLDPAGSCYTRESVPIRKKLYSLISWAGRHRIPIISTVLRVRPRENGPLSPIPHCIEGTDGERKMPGTLLPRRINLGLRNTTDLPPDLFERYQQAIFEKRDTDIFVHARAERLISELGRCTFIICGAGVARGIVQAAIGLRERGFGVVLAQDAVLELDDPSAEMAWKRMGAKGVIIAPSHEIVTLAPRPIHRMRRTARAS